MEDDLEHHIGIAICDLKLVARRPLRDRGRAGSGDLAHIVDRGRHEVDAGAAAALVRRDDEHGIVSFSPQANSGITLA